MAKKKNSEEKEVFENDEQLVESLILDLNEEFGEGTMTLEGTDYGQVTTWVSSGSPVLDAVLGGGYPAGRIVEIFGAESNGKCLTEDSRVLTATGYKTIKEIFERCGLEVCTANKDVMMLYSLENRYGDIENTTHFTYNGRKKVNKIVTDSGIEIKATLNHPLLVVNEMGFFVWREVKDIKPGDQLVAKINNFRFPLLNLLSKEQAYLLGVLYTDVSLSEEYLEIAPTDKCVEDAVLSTKAVFPELEKMWIYICGEDSEKSYYFHEFDEITRFYKKYGISRKAKKFESIPVSVSCSGFEVQKEFLRGYFDNRCVVEDDGSLSVISLNIEILKEIKLMLMNMGIVSKFERVIDREDKECGKLSLSGVNAYNYLNLVGTCSKEKAFDFNNKYRKDMNYKTLNYVPNMRGLVESFYHSLDKEEKNFDIEELFVKDNISISNLSKLLSLKTGDERLLEHFNNIVYGDFYFDEVKENEYYDFVRTFDFAMEETHSFIVDGVVSHNTTVALHALAETQNAGGIGIFLDTEHALDKRRAKSIGVDLKRLIYAQPETMEVLFKYIEEIIDLLQKKTPDKLITIVWDSVAATPTESEVEGEFGDAIMGIHGRIMSQAFRKITGLISKHKVLFICINQVRDKIGGVSWGEKTSTFGGRALKFHATQRLEVKRIGNYKEGDKILGISCQATVKKNKVSPPFGVANFNILFRDEYGGIDPFSSLLDSGFELGMFGTSKGWFSIQGKNYRKAEAVELLEGDAELWKMMIDTYMSLV